MTATIVDDESAHNDLDTKKGEEAIRLSIPPRFYLVPSAAIIVGSAIGIVRGSGRASLRFLAENAHRPPTTVQGWYFYNKTKNYKVLWGGLKGAGVEAGKLGAVALGWVGIEEGLERVGWGQVGEVGAALGTAGVFSAVCEWDFELLCFSFDLTCLAGCADRLPWKTTKRTLALGLIIGGSMSGMKWGRVQLAQQQRTMGNQATEE
ncbi:hypothetical protein DXG03_003477 [Asterophora parasitica]|uniref:Uncharacterized protein n=1 Tax=Asterophora parasitica TaxID=117018 RepID=A0A9P7G9C2_9AGAR|nr:hypothetical protein DXG03_003477 [Asterophora parasitica]